MSSNKTIVESILGRTPNGIAVLASHGVYLQRYAANGERVTVGAGTTVAPSEFVRIVAGGEFRIGDAEFVITGPLVDVGPAPLYFQGKANINLAGNAWLDFVAPPTPGTYLVVSRFPNALWGSHEVSITFDVHVEATPPPADKPGTSFIEGVKGVGTGVKDIFGDVKWILIVGAVVAAIVVLGPTLKGISKKGEV